MLVLLVLLVQLVQLFMHLGFKALVMLVSRLQLL